MSKSPPFDLCMVYKTVYEQETKQEYDLEPRDLRQAKLLLALNPDWNLEKMELKIRSHFPQYRNSEYWREQNFPAYGLFTSFNSFKPNPVKKQEKRTNEVRPIKEILIWCEHCNSQVRDNHFCERVK